MGHLTNPSSVEDFGPLTEVQQAVAIRTKRNRTKGVKLFWQPFHDDELIFFGSPATMVRCFTLLVRGGGAFARVTAN